MDLGHNIMSKAGPEKEMVLASGRMLWGPTSNLGTLLLPLCPVLISSDHWRFPENATSAGAPHLPHLQLQHANSGFRVDFSKNCFM